ncbi:hypothetical protein SDJN02_12329, partial [Cucurbita argyrosperma subsp. argyrosperma]
MSEIVLWRALDESLGGLEKLLLLDIASPCGAIFVEEEQEMLVRVVHTVEDIVFYRFYVL